VARTKEFDPEAALEAAVDVFWRKGYEKTSLDDLIEAMGVGRQSLYNTFGDKRALYLRALDEYRTSTQRAMLRLFSSRHSVRECFGALLYGIAKESRADHERGCLLLSASLERDGDDADVAALVRRNQSEVERLFETALRDAQQRGELGAEKDPAALASFMLSTIQGMRHAARAKSDRTSLERVATIALSALH
jgi:TetR/AcrR family transcriptional regulator, transcriptional repressor for nem operon